jgi:hypothetical protein
MGETVTDRIPFHSTLFGGLALALFVALPMTVAACLAATGAPRTAEATMPAGALLVGWIVVQVLIIRTFSWLQPAMALTGATESMFRRVGRVRRAGFQVRCLRITRRNWAMRAVPSISVSKTDPTAAINNATASGVLVVIHRNEISVLRVFCTKKTISSTARSAAPMRATQAAPVRVCGTRADGDSCGGSSGVGSGVG